MSDTVRCYGKIGILEKPLDEEAREELSEKFWDDKSLLGINYEGTLVYFDANSHKSYRERTNIYGLQLEGETEEQAIDLVVEAAKHGLTVLSTSVRAYNCIYYNGGDNPVNELTKDDFLARTFPNISRLRFENVR